MKQIRLVLMILIIMPAALAASIWTTDIDGNNQYDYSPYEVVYIKGAGFVPSSSIDLAVLRPDGITDYGSSTSDAFGNLQTYYDMTLMVGNYTVTAFDGVNYAYVTFTDAAIWSTTNDCGNSTQDANQFNIGENVHINGDGFSSGSYDWEIKGQPGGASCDPNIVVASGTHVVNATGAFCIDAYLVADDDCGVYQIKFSNKGDNYNVDEGSCTVDSNCGSPINTIFCDASTLVNKTITPTCIGNGCVNITTTQNTTCAYGCQGSECLVPVCGNNVIEGDEECDDGNILDDDGCSSQCIVEYCGDQIINNVTETCDDGANNDDTDGCFDDCSLTYCGDSIVQAPNGYNVSEACDLGNTSCTTTQGYSGISECLQDCSGYGACITDEYCGDSIVNGNEVCDDGAQGSEACTVQCTLVEEEPYCGDSVVNGNEACEFDEDCSEGYYCDAQCQCQVVEEEPYCGDGIVNGDEQCESSGDCAEGHSCSIGCTCEQIVEEPYCGDGTVNQESEECDDGNSEDYDGCSSSCRLEGGAVPLMPSYLILLLFIAAMVLGMRK